MNSNNKLLTIITVSFNTVKLLDLCLGSVYRSLSKENLDSTTEVIIVDNNSQDGSVEMVKEKYPQVILIENSKNLGFAKANNIGIRKSKGKFLLLLNSDTQILDGSLRTIVKTIEVDNIGVVGVKLINTDNTIQPSAGFFPTIPKIFIWMTFLDDLPIISKYLKPYHVENPGFYQYKNKVDWVSGAFIIIRRTAIEKAGMLDENIFMYGEEVELCYRIKRKGYEVVYQPCVKVLHSKGGSSIGFNAGILDEFKFILYFYNKYFPKWQNKIVRYVLGLGALLRIAVFGIIRRYPQRTKIYAQAFKLVRW